MASHVRQPSLVRFPGGARRPWRPHRSRRMRAPSAAAALPATLGAVQASCHDGCAAVGRTAVALVVAYSVTSRQQRRMLHAPRTGNSDAKSHKAGALTGFSHEPAGQPASHRQPYQSMSISACQSWSRVMSMSMSMGVGVGVVVGSSGFQHATGSPCSHSNVPVPRRSRPLAILAHRPSHLRSELGCAACAGTRGRSHDVVSTSVRSVHRLDTPRPTIQQAIVRFVSGRDATRGGHCVDATRL